jgi:hypothetical protein
MERSQSCTNLSGADLSGAILNQTNLACAPAAIWWMYNEINRTDCLNLRNANLSGADVRFADLSGANPNGADVTLEQLRQAESLLGARMPNGQKHEERGGAEVAKRLAYEGCEGDPTVVNTPSHSRQEASNACVESVLD